MSKARDMTGTGRYAPQPFFQPIVFYNSIRFGDPEVLAHLMAVDPFYLTQDNGAGAPVHFATTYKQLDMLHHLLNSGASVNQQDPRGLTPLHRAAYLAHLDGYIEIYEYLLSRGADPSITADKYDKYLAPGPKYPWELAAHDDIAESLRALDAQYAHVTKAPRPNPYIGDWWTLYDYGFDTVRSWPYEYVPDFPEERRKKREAQARADAKAAKRAQREAFLRALQDAGPDAARAVLRELASGDRQGTNKGGNKQGSARPPKAGAHQGPMKTLPAPATAPAKSQPFYAFLFPGQGSQAIGMLRDSCELPEVKEYLSIANRVLGYDLLDICLNGTKEQLDDTRVAQPALLIAGLAAAARCKTQAPIHAQARRCLCIFCCDQRLCGYPDLLKDLADHVGGTKDPSAFSQCAGAAGLSLGEYSALVWAGAMSVEDGIKVVKVRAEAMSSAAGQGTPHGMLSVVGLPDDKLQQLCDRVLGEVSVEGGTVLKITNYLFPQGRVVSGHTEALTKLSQLATSEGALKATMLAVSGAFHTRLMEPAREALAKALSEVDIRTPRVPVISNVTAQPFPDSPEDIRTLLARQLVEPVQWESTLRWMVQRGEQGAGSHARLFELGPGQQIKAMVRRMDGTVWKAFNNIQA